MSEYLKKLTAEQTNALVEFIQNSQGQDNLLFKAKSFAFELLEEVLPSLATRKEISQSKKGLHTDLMGSHFYCDGSDDLNEASFLDEIENLIESLGIEC